MNVLFGRLRAGAVSFLTAIVLLVPMAAAAAPFDVYVGYADGLRGTGFFPSPWSGDAGVTFLGVTGSGADAGAILISNTSGSSLTIDSVGVTINYTGNIAPSWALPVTLAAGDSLVLTETYHYNFDTSDMSYITSPGSPVTNCSVTCPTVTIGWGGSNSQTFLDSSHTLDTLGFDYASVGNESFNWRLIGSCSGPGCGGVVGAVPEPETYAMMLAGLGLLGFAARRRKQKEAAAA
jgi:hypothetical protein